jgi:hypothetical protein
MYSSSLIKSNWTRIPALPHFELSAVVEPLPWQPYFRFDFDLEALTLFRPNGSLPVL